jgi:uncharacterized protein (TIRG00374 family)
MRNLLLLLAGGIIFAVLIFLKLDLEGLVNIVLERLSWTFYSLICIAITAQLVFRSIRFRLLFNNVFEYKIPQLKAFLLTSASFFVALATPVKLGDMTRGVFLKGKGLEITAISIIEYLLDVIIVLAVPIFGMIFLYRYYLSEIVTAYLFLSLGLAALFILLRYARVKDFLKRTRLYSKGKDKIDLLKQYFKKGLKNKVILSIGFFCTCLSYNVIFTIYYVVLQKLGAGTTFLEVIIAAGTGFLLGSLTFIPMGLGTRDASTYGILTVLGTDADLALSAVVIMRSLSLTLILVSGSCYFLSIRRINQ